MSISNPSKAMLQEESKKSIFMKDGDWDKIALYLIGSQQRFRDNIIIPRTAGPVRIKTIDEKRMDSITESCTVTCIYSCCIGYIAGVAITLFGYTFASSTAGLEKQPTVRETFREMMAMSSSHGKNFAVIGGIYSAVECTIESYRGKTDWKNYIYAASFTGGLLGLRGGVKAGLFGAAGFTAFSAAINWFTNRE